MKKVVNLEKLVDEIDDDLDSIKYELNNYAKIFLEMGFFSYTVDSDDPCFIIKYVNLCNM